MNRDKHNVIGQIQADGSVEGGDSLAWMGHRLALTKDDYWTVGQFIHEFEVEPGQWVRNPYPESSNYGWAAFNNGTYDGVLSRDQLTGMLHCICTHKKYKAILRFCKEHLKRGFLFTNNTVKNGSNPTVGEPSIADLSFFLGCIFNSKNMQGRKLPNFTLFDIWAMIIRGLSPYTIMLWPLLVVFDLQTVFNAIVNRFRTVQEDDDVISHCGKCILGARVMPTPTMWLANKINNNDDMNNKILSYFMRRGLTDMAYDWEDLIDRYMG